jgi:hypothetical protein
VPPEPYNPPAPTLEPTAPESVDDGATVEVEDPDEEEDDGEFEADEGDEPDEE